MKRLLMFAGALVFLCSDAAATEWLTDLPAAMARAQKENKAVLLDFTGSDWCGWCMKLRAEVFDTLEFGAYAAGNLILVEVDFPDRKKISTEQLNANYALATKHGITGYPTIVVLSSDGRVLGRTGYMRGGPTVFVGALEKFPGLPHKGGYLIAKSTDSAAHSPALSAQPPLPAAAPPASAAPPSRYGELTLKGISKAGNGRLAFINNEPMKVGEKASVKSFGTNIEVTVKEIRDDSVVIVVQGQTRELSMNGPPGGKP